MKFNNFEEVKARFTELVNKLQDPESENFDITNFYELINLVYACARTKLEEGNAAAADDFLPTLIFLIQQTDTKDKLLSFHNIISKLLPENDKGELCNYLTHIESATTFLTEQDKEEINKILDEHTQLTSLDTELEVADIKDQTDFFMRLFKEQTDSKIIKFVSKCFLNFESKFPKNEKSPVKIFNIYDIRYRQIDFHIIFQLELAITKLRKEQTRPINLLLYKFQLRRENFELKKTKELENIKEKFVKLAEQMVEEKDEKTREEINTNMINLFKNAVNKNGDKDEENSKRNPIIKLLNSFISLLEKAGMYKSSETKLVKKLEKLEKLLAPRRNSM